MTPTKLSAWVRDVGGGNRGSEGHLLTTHCSLLATHCSNICNTLAPNDGRCWRASEGNVQCASTTVSSDSSNVNPEESSLPEFIDYCVFCHLGLLLVYALRYTWAGGGKGNGMDTGSKRKPNRQQNSSMGLKERMRAYTPPPEHPLTNTGHILALQNCRWDNLYW